MTLTQEELSLLTEKALNNPSRFDGDQMATVISCLREYAQECADSLGVHLIEIGSIIGSAFEIGYFAGLQAAQKELQCKSQSPN